MYFFTKNVLFLYIFFAIFCILHENVRSDFINFVL